MKKVLLLLFTIMICLHARSQSTRILIQFTDKNGSSFTFNNPSAYLSARAIQRRINYSIAIDSTDLPCNPSYVDQVRAQGAVTVLSQSKWLNQILIKTSDATAIARIMALPFVKNTQPIAPRLAITKDKFELERQAGTLPEEYSRTLADYYTYGNSYNQVHMHEGEFLHNHGFRGQNMIVTILDGGFRNYRTITAFDSVRMNGQILGERDYVNFDGSVNEDIPHGMQCLSTMAANWPGRMVGTAPGASFWLVRTEEDATEYPVEEHNWVAGAEFGDSSGTDLISSSLGYTTFDDTTYNHTYNDFYKRSTMVSIGAGLAAKKGIIVTNSAGNDGATAWKYLGFPADADSVCAVGSVTSTGAISSFSSYGYPGKIKPNVVSKGSGTTIAGNTAPTTGNGTSYSNPNLCGLITCLWQAFPRFNNMKVLDALYKSGDRYTAPTDRFGFGIPNMKTAYRLLKKDENIILYGNDWYWATPDNFIDTVAVRLIGRIDGNARVDILNPSGAVVATHVFVTEKEEVYNYVFSNLVDYPAGLYTFRYSDDSLTTRGISLRKAAVLPLNDLIIKAIWMGGSALVNWSAGSEVNTASYTVQRSVNGADFKDLGTTKASGNNSGASNYSSEDKEVASLLSPVFYYRLKVTDLDGKQKLSSIVKLPALVHGMSMIITPNPARDLVTLTVSSTGSLAAVVEIRSANGQLMRKQAAQLTTGTNTLQVRLNGLAKGEYFIKVNNGTRTLQDKLMVY